MSIRKAFRMSVNRGAELEYERRHQPIWDELEQVLYAHGVSTYTIFLDASNGDLFGYVEVASNAQWDAIAQTEVCKRWWRYMSELMPSNADASPRSRPLREVFHLDEGHRPAQMSNE